ncbi:MAG: hypothetical protein H6713_16270 [Myxococcales bacterium]|nr:hypothetical protein [Myxococcales bacterium]
MDPRRARALPLAALVDGPPMRDPALLLAMRVLSTVTAHAGIHDELQLVVATNRQLRLSLSHGTSVHTAQALCLHAAVVGELLRDVDYACACADAVERLLARFPVSDISGRARMMISNLLRSWRDPLRAIWETTRDAKRLSLERGALEAAILAALAQDFCALAISRPLQVAELESRESYQQLERLRQLARAGDFDIPCSPRQLMLCLLGEAEDPAALRGAAVDADVVYARYDARGDVGGKWTINFCEAQLKHLFGRHEDVERAVDEIDADPFPLLRRRFPSAFVHMFAALSLLELARRGRA